MLNKKSKIIISLLIVLFVFNFVFITPRSVQAQMIVSDVGKMVQDSTQWIKDAVEKTKDFFTKRLVSTFVQKLAGSFLNKIAYDAAVELTEGDPGKKPKIFSSNAEEYWKEAGMAAAGTALTDLAQGTLNLPFDICKPPSFSSAEFPKLNVNLSMRLYNIKANNSDNMLKSSKCSLADMEKNWKKAQDEFDDVTSGNAISDLWDLTNATNLLTINGKDIGELTNGAASSREDLLKSMLNPYESQATYVLDIAELVENKEKLAQDYADFIRPSINSTKIKTDPITDRLLETPSDAKQNEEKATEPRGFFQATGDVVADALGVFISTTSNRLRQRAMDYLFKRLSKSETNKSMSFDSGIYDFSLDSSKDYIDQIYATIKKINYSSGSVEIDLISEMNMNLRDSFSGTPGNLNDGVIDSNFAEALRRAQTGVPLTLRQAIDENLINGGKIFGFKDLQNTQLLQPELDEGVSYENMKKLRKNRVIPVGWEMAALKIASLVKQGIQPCLASGCTISDMINQYSEFGTYKYANDNKSIKDNRCGWVLASSEPYNLYNKNTEASCGENNADTVKNLKFKWVGSSNVAGVCYKYSFNENGVLSNIESTANTQVECENFTVETNSYYEWLPGGCLVKEKDESEFCGLVNPDWVLKAPAQKCFAKGYYSALELNESADRYQECADVRHCIREDEYGKCIGDYAYCLREKNIWRFQGDSCDKNFSGCVTLKDDEKKTKSYIESTLKNCPQEQVGCRDYEYEKSYDEESKSYSWTNNSEKKIYFNSVVASCQKKDEGCSNFIRIEQGVNLIKNGGLEIDEGPSDKKPDGWMIENSSLDNDYEYIKKDDYSNGNYFESPGNLTLSTNINIPGNGIYVFSYDVRNVSSGNAEGDIGLNPSVVTPHIIIGGNDTILENAKFDSATSAQWEKKYATYYVNSSSAVNNLILKLELSGQVYLDNFQFEFVDHVEPFFNPDTEDEEGLQVYYPSSYKEYGSSSNAFFKKAPDYYNCSTDSDRAECQNFLKYCSRENNGCDSYKPTNGDPTVTAIIAGKDRCPSACSGFQTYSEIPNYFDYLEVNESTDGEVGLPPTSKDFISSNAKKCNEPSCEEFTNIDAVEQGGEGKEYYKKLRFCVKPEEVETTIYYTWEGSDTSGFQLKTWRLLKSQNDGAPCTKVGINESSCIEDEEIDSCDPEANFDCRTFYDMQSNVYNRLQSSTIPITDECIRLRRTLTNTIFKVVPSLSKRCSASNVGCMEYKGNNGNNVKIVLSEDFERGTINPWSFGSNGNLGKLTAENVSESLQYGGHSIELKTEDQSANNLILQYNLKENGVTLSPGKQYILSFWAKKFSRGESDGEVVDDNISYSGFDNLKYFRFLNKASAATSDDSSDLGEVDDGDGQTSTSAEMVFVPGTTVIDSEDWSLYEYNIVIPPDNISTALDALLKIQFKINNSSALYDGIYVDNIIIKEVKNNFYIIRDSWNTPKECIDSNDDGVIDNKYLGCEAYTKRDRSKEYLYKFSDLCYSENIGCRAMIDTKNSSMPFKQTFNAYCEDSNNGNECSSGKYYYLNDRNPLGMNKNLSTVSVPEDSIVYVIDNNKYKCDSKSKGCQNFAVYNNEGKPQDVFKINNPDYYITDDYFGGSQIQNLCLSDYKNCVAFSKKDGGFLYKIHPRENVCEYRKEDKLSNMPGGFYKVGKDESCSGLLYNGNYNNLAGSDQYEALYDLGEGYAALCPDNQNSCTTFIDPKDKTDQLPSALSNANVNNPLLWRIFNWNMDNGSVAIKNGYLENMQDGTIKLGSDPNGILLMFAGRPYSDNSINKYDFLVQGNAVYKLSASVKFEELETDEEIDGNRFISTFLLCKNSKIAGSYYLPNTKIPYANPNISSRYFVTENNTGNFDWQNIYGLYTLAPETNFCNIAFYIYGAGEEAQVSIKDVKFEKINGYYSYLDNDNLDKTSCQSPSAEKGCVLFNQITNSTLKWNTEKSYENINLTVGDSSYANDANTLLKVAKDRICGEWITCGSSVKSIDESTGQEKNLCTSLIACNELSGDNSECLNFVTRNQDVKPLILEDYQSELGKNFYWSDMDYSGYSIPGNYPIDSLSLFELEEDGDYKLGRVVSKENVSGGFNVYKFGAGTADPINSYWSANNYNPSMEKSCRLYPEKDSPFIFTPQIVLDAGDVVTSNSGSSYVNPVQLNSRFERANICQPIIDSEGNIDFNNLNNNCDCSYTKVTYKNSKNLYFPYQSTNIPDQIKDEYVEDNFVMKKSQMDYSGWRGFCLENDNSFFATPISSPINKYNYRCLSWYPIDILSGETDSYLSSPEAKVPIPLNSKICLSGEDYVITQPRLYCAYWSSNKNESDAGLYGLSRSDNGAGNYSGNNQDTEARCNVLAYIPENTKMNNIIPDDQNQEELKLFLEYINGNYYKMPGQYAYDNIDTGDGHNYKIIYGTDWEDWYKDEVFNGNFTCDKYAWHSNYVENSNIYQEKEIKFKSSDFGGYHANSYDGEHVEDVNFINLFKNIFTDVEFYFYDEGVMPNIPGGQTYLGNGTDLGVYEWDDTDSGVSGKDKNHGGFQVEPYYRAKIDDNNPVQRFFIPLANKVRVSNIDDNQHNQNSDNRCGLMENVGDNYKNACDLAKNKFGTTNSINNAPKAHEVFTNCYIESDFLGGSESNCVSYWNPRPYNYYVHYEHDNTFAYNENNENPSSFDYDGFNENMTIHGYATNPFQACKYYGALDGEGPNDAIFHSDNYYINTLDLSEVASELFVSTICGGGNNSDGICSDIQVAKLGSQPAIHKLRVKQITSGAFTSVDVLNIPDFAHNSSQNEENLRNLMFYYPDEGFESFDGYYTGSSEYSQLQSRLQNSIVKIPEVKKYESGSWIVQSGIDWTGSEDGPSVKQVVTNGEGGDGITVNGFSGRNLVAVNRLKSNLSFYAYAKWGRSPIDKIIIDWYGNGENKFEFSGPFKNRKFDCERRCGQDYMEINWTNPEDKNPTCSIGSDCSGDMKCFSHGWGNTEDSCVQSKFEYSFIYACSPDNSLWRPDCDGSGPSSQPCCVFRPNVKVFDSWGDSTTEDMGGDIILTTNQGIIDFGGSGDVSDVLDMNN